MGTEPSTGPAAWGVWTFSESNSDLSARQWLNSCEVLSNGNLGSTLVDVRIVMYSFTLRIIQNSTYNPGLSTWWRHRMETFSPLLALCTGNSPLTGEFPSQRPVTRSFDVFFGLRLNKRLSKQSRHRWFETPSRPLWRHCNENSEHWLCGVGWKPFLGLMWPTRSNVRQHKTGSALA